MIVGIDPGLSGALFFLDPRDPATGESVDLPVHLLTRGGKSKREVYIAGLIGILALHRLTLAYVDQVGAMPGQGISSVFAFGKVLLIILGVLAARSVPLILVAPARWKRALGVVKAKDAARARVSQLPLKKHDGRAEAALIALYGARQLSGTAAVPADIFILSVRP
jgi:crossover junction endodeoxyribonuclease RuvC